MDSLKDEDSQAVDESCMDSETKENNKDGIKKDKDKSEKEENDKKESDKESDKEVSDKNEKEESEKEGSEKEENEKDGSEKEESEDEDGEKEMGLLDRPVEVTGCRARTKMEKLEISFNTPKEKAGIRKGRGQKLEECPRIAIRITKRPVSDLIILHRILFSRPGSVRDTKRNIRKFCGFPFVKGSREYEEKKEYTKMYSLLKLREVCEILDLEESGNREDVVSRILEFLLAPKDSRKALPKKKSLSRDKKKTGDEKAKRNKKTPKAKATSGEDDEIAPSDPSDDDSGGDDDAGGGDAKERDYEIKKKSKNAIKVRKTPAKKVVKKEIPQKESAKGTKRKRGEPTDSSDDDDEPPVKKSKVPSVTHSPQNGAQAAAFNVNTSSESSTFLEIAKEEGTLTTEAPTSHIETDEIGIEDTADDTTTEEDEYSPLDDEQSNSSSVVIMDEVTHLPQNGAQAAASNVPTSSESSTFLEIAKEEGTLTAEAPTSFIETDEIDIEDTEDDTTTEEEEYSPLADEHSNSSSVVIIDEDSGDSQLNILFSDTSDGENVNEFQINKNGGEDSQSQEIEDDVMQIKRLTRKQIKRPLLGHFSGRGPQRLAPISGDRNMDRDIDGNEGEENSTGEACKSPTIEEKGADFVFKVSAELEEG